MVQCEYGFVNMHPVTTIEAKETPKLNNAMLLRSCSAVETPVVFS